MAKQEKAGPADVEAEVAPENASATGTENAEDTGNGDADFGHAVADGTDETVSERSTVNGMQSSEVEQLRNTINALESENTELKNQYLRKQADLENYRKRMVRDKENAVQFSNQQLILDLTTIIDDFERAIRSAEESRDYDSFHDGIVLIENHLTSMLERKWGLKRFDSEGEVFDPQKHEAVTTEPRSDHEESLVIEDYQKGYMLHDRVLRSAKVKVSMPAAEDDGTKKE